MSNYAKCKWCGTEFRKSAMKRFIGENTAGIGGRQKYCSNRCKREAEAAKNKDKADKEKNKADKEVKKAAPASGGGGTVIIQKESGLGAFTRSMGSGVGSLASSAKNGVEGIYQREKDEKEALEAKIENVASIEFSKDPDEIQNQLNKLLSIAASRPDKKVRKAIIEKMEFGIMKLSASGSGPEVAFFKEKLDKFKKRGRI